MIKKMFFLLFVLVLLVSSVAVAKNEKTKLTKNFGDGTFQFVDWIDSPVDSKELEKFLKFSNKKVSLDHKKFSFLNSPAYVSFNDCDFLNPVALHNNYLDPSVEVVVTDSVCYLTVPYWSVWSIINNTWPGSYDGVTVGFGSNLTWAYDQNFYIDFSENNLNSSEVWEKSQGSITSYDTTTPSRSNNCYYANECYRFDGTNDYLNMNTNLFSGREHKGFSILTNVYTDPTSFDGSIDIIMDTNTGDPVNADGFWLAFDDRGSGNPIDGVQFAVATDSGSYRNTFSENTIIGTQWYNIMVSYNGSNSSIYINGQDNTTKDGVDSSGTGNFTPSNEDLYFSSLNDGSLNLNGIQECVLFYNNSQEQPLANLFYSWSRCGWDAFSYHSFDNDFSDSSGNGYDLTKFGGVYRNTGLLNNASIFEDTTDYLQVNNYDYTTDEGTIAFWVNFADTNRSRGLVHIREDAGPSTDYLRVYITGSTNRIEILSKNNSNILLNAYFDLDNLDDYVGTWQHFAFVSNATNVSLYINGSKESLSFGVASQHWTEFLTENKNMIVGGTSWALHNGSIDEFGIWNRALSEQELFALYANGYGINPYDGLVEAWPLNNYSKNITSMSGQNNGDAGPFNKWLVNYPVSYVSFNWDNGTNPYDHVTGEVYEVQGTNKGLGYSGFAYNFSGVNPSVNLNKEYNASNGLTVSAWVNPAEYTVTYGNCIVCTSYMNYNTASDTVGKWGLYLNSVGNPIFKHYGTVSDFYQVGTSQAPLNTWTHFVGVINETNISIYRNGILTDADYINHTDLIGAAEYGTYIGGDPRFLFQDHKGKIDEVLIYDRALSTNEIVNIYNSSPHTIQSFDLEGDHSIDVPLAQADNYKPRTNNYAVSFWMKHGAYTGEEYIFRHTKGAGSGDWGMSLYNGDIYIYHNDGVTNRDYQLVGDWTPIFTNTWQHVLVNYNRSGSAKGYLNGNYIGEYDISTAPGDINPSSTMTIGQSSNNRYYTGDLDELRFFHRLLTTQEIQELANNNASFNLYKEGNYTSENFTATDYDPQIIVNYWDNVTLSGDVAPPGLNVFYSLDCTGDVWTEAINYDNGIYGVEGQSDCLSLSLNPFGGDGYTSFLLDQLNITSTKYLLPETVINAFVPSPAYTNDSLIVNAQWLLNDTDAGLLQFDWYVNNVSVFVENSSLITNGTNATSLLDSSYFVKDNDVWVTVTPFNFPVIGEPVNTSIITVSNYWFNFTYHPTNNASITLQKPLVKNFRIIFSQDIDNDAVVSWYVNNGITESLKLSGSDSYTLLSTAYEDGDVLTLTANITDGEYNGTVQWTVQITPANVQMVAAIPLIFFLLFITAGLLVVPFFFDPNQEPFKNRLIRRGCWTVALFIMMFNSGVMATVMESAGIALADEMFFLMQLFGWAGFTLLLISVITSLKDLLHHVKDKREAKRMGEDYD